MFTKYTKGRELYWETSPDGRTWSDDRKLARMGELGRDYVLERYTRERVRDALLEAIKSASSA